MSSFSIWHWVILFVLVALPLWLISRVAIKAGFSGWWAFVFLVPFVNIVMLWVFSYAKWPGQPQN